MKFKKVVFIRYLPLTKAIYTNLYFQEIQENGIEIEYLDVTKMFFPKDDITINTFYFEGNIEVLSYENLREYFRSQNNKETLFISIMSFEWRVFKLFRIFTKYKLNLGVFSRGVFPSQPDSKKSKVERIIKTLSLEKIKGFIANKITHVSKKTGYIKRYDYIFKAGDYGALGLGVGSEIDLKKAQIIEVNTVDYDQFLISKEIPIEKKDSYIVFLDQYLPYHPDVKLFKIKTVEASRYYKELNYFFSKIELLTSKKVIIAGHPKADSYKAFNPFNDRPIFIGKSNELVKGASIVLTHASTAICFPICYEKKLILLMSEQINEALPQFIRVAKSIKRACGATIIYIDKKAVIKIPDTTNFKEYDDYKYKYLTSLKSSNKLSKEIFINFLKGNY